MTPTAGFAVAVRWTGPQDKPYPGALLVSEDAPEAADAEPWVSVTTITRDEFDSAVRGIEGSLADGQFRGSDGYVAEVRDGDDHRHAPLGVGRSATELLETMAGALRPEHARALAAVLDRAGRAGC